MTTFLFKSNMSCLDIINQTNDHFEISYTWCWDRKVDFGTALFRKRSSLNRKSTIFRNCMKKGLTIKNNIMFYY